MPDPMLRVVSRLLDRQNRLEERIRVMEQSLPTPEAEALRATFVCESQIRDVLREVIDPEVGIDIVDLGLIKDIIVKGNQVEIDMILTSKACPLVSHLSDQIERKVLGVCGIEHVEVKVLDEPWNWDRFVKQRGVLKEI
jgi:serine O-acetyltransferase